MRNKKRRQNKKTMLRRNRRRRRRRIRQNPSVCVKKEAPKDHLGP